MRILLVGAMLACLLLMPGPPSAAADGGWQRVYSRPGTDVSAITMFDDAHGLAIAGAGVLRTEDGGANWTSPADDPAMEQGQIAYADAQHAWAATLAGGIWRTDDGGATWTTQDSGTDAHMSAFAVISADEAWVTAVGEGFSDVATGIVPKSVLLHTIDAGRTWQRVPVAGYGQFYDVTFAGAHGWLTASRCHPGDPTILPAGGERCDDTHVLLVSDDAGGTWTPLAPQPLVHPDHLHFFDATHGYGTFATCAADGCRTQLFATDDGGLTWALRDAGAGQVQAYRFTTPDNGWLSIGICGGNGCQTRLAHTKDGGATFADVDVPPPSITSPPAAGLAVTSGAVFVSGGATGIERYDIARGTWSEATTGARPGLSGVIFATRDRGYALQQGQTNAFLRTDDGGRTWEERETPSVVFALAATPGVVWAAATCPAVCLFRSEDGGDHWTAVATPAGFDRGALSLQAFGDRVWLTAEGASARSDDGGKTWQTLVRPDGPLGFSFIDHDHGFVNTCDGPGCASEFLYTSDGGVTSEVRPLPALASVAYFFSADVGFATARDAAEPNGNCPCVAYLYRTDDGGRTWQELQKGDDEFDSLIFADAQHGWAVRYHLGQTPGEIVATSDGGRTWQPDLDAPPGAFTAAGGRLWMTVRISANPYVFGRTDIYRLDVGSAAPDITAPDTGTTDADSPDSFRRPEVALLAGGVLLILLVGAGGWVLRRRRGSLP